MPDHAKKFHRSVSISGLSPTNYAQIDIPNTTTNHSLLQSIFQPVLSFLGSGIFDIASPLKSE